MNSHHRVVLIAAFFSSFAAGCAGEQPSDDPPTPLGEVQQAFISHDANEVRAGTDHTCVRRYDGRVTCWGQAYRGQKGDGVTPPPMSQLVPGADALVLTKTLEPGTLLAASSDRACVLIPYNKTVKCWGTSVQDWPGGAEGPTPGVLPFANVDAIEISKREHTTGQDDTGCVLSGGAVTCWGNNGDGMLGLGTSDSLPHPTPTAVPGLGNNVAQIALGEDHACARFTNGTVTCWGSNSTGQLGNGTTSVVPTTTVGPPIAGLTGVVQLAAGVAHTCALKSDGTLRCWGFGGTVGDGTMITRTTPTMPVQFVAAAEIVAGFNFTCLRTVDNHVQCWGTNSYGELGVGSNTAKTIPTATGLADVTQLTAGESHACARKSSTHEVFCWGRNYWGQVGDGTTTNRTVPTKVIGLP